MAAFSVVNLNQSGSLITFSSGDLIRADEINSNFQHLEQRLAELENLGALGNLVNHTWTVILTLEGGSVWDTFTLSFSTVNDYWTVNQFSFDGVTFDSDLNYAFTLSRYVFFEGEDISENRRFWLEGTMNVLGNKISGTFSGSDEGTFEATRN